MYMCQPPCLSLNLNLTGFLLHVYCTTGMYSDGAVLSGQELFLCEEKALRDLCAFLVLPCPCHSSAVSWQLDAVQQVI